MAPYFNILGIDLYTIMICIGLLVAIVLFRILCDKKKLPANVFNFFYHRRGGRHSGQFPLRNALPELL